MTPEEQELTQALVAADAAGDTQAATRIASAIHRMRGQAQQIGGMSTFDKAAVGVGRGFSDVGQGLKQMSLQAGEAFAGLPGPAKAAVSMLAPGAAFAASRANAAPGTAAEYTAGVQDELGEYEALRKDSPYLTGGGRLVGNIAALPIPAGTGATLAARAGTSALAGGAQGAVQFVPEGGSRLTNTALGATIGALIPGLIEGGKVTVGAVRKLADTMKSVLPTNMTQAAREQTVARLVNEALANPANLAKLSQPSQLVAGTRQTIAEATDDRGLAALQNTLANQSGDFKNQLGELAAQNNVARVGAIQGAFGGADEASAVAIEQARNQAALPLLRQAQQIVGVNVKPVVQLADRIVKSRDGRPAVQSAVQKVRDLLVRDVAPQDRAKNALAAIMEAKGRKMSSADFEAVKGAATITRRVASGALSEDDALAALKRLKPTSVVAQRAIKSGRDLLSQQTKGVDDIHRLYNARQTIDDMLKGSAGAESDAARAASRELMTIKRSLDHQMRAVSDEFGDYLSRFSSMSRDAGQVRMGAELLTKSAGTLDAAGNPVLSPAKFGAARRDLDRVAQQATGFRKQTAERLMSPEQLKLANAIGSDLDRVARVGQAGTAIGSNTAQNLERLGALRSSAAGIEGDVRQVALSSVPVVGKVLDRFNQHYGEKVMGILREVALDPQSQRSARILASLPAAQRQKVTAALQNPQIRQALEALRVAGPSATAAAVVGGQEQR